MLESDAQQPEIPDSRANNLPEEQEDLRAMVERQSGYQELLGQVHAWEQKTGQKIDTETSEHGYPVLDLTSGDPEQMLNLLKSLDPDGKYVYHGMQNNEYRRDADMPDVDAWESLDPDLSHQEEGRKRVYATRRLKGGLTHALVEHRFRDANPNGGQTYALKPFRSEDGRTVEVSPALHEAMATGEIPFTEGLLYILPREGFVQNPDSDHELIADHRVRPVAVIKVGPGLGPHVVQPDDVELQP